MKKITQFVLEDGSPYLINITENIGCRVLVDLPKHFDTVVHQTLLPKLNYFWICGVSNDDFKSNPSNYNQFVSINGYDSDLTALNCGVPQDSVPGLLLFLLYINGLNQTIKFCKVDDTNLLCLSNCIKKLNKLANADLKHLVNWLKSNKIALSVKKT